MPTNRAQWLRSAGGKLHEGEAPYTPPDRGQVVVKTAALAMNTIDVIPGLARRLLLPWLRYPVVLGSDVAGEIVEVGPGESRLKAGDRVVGHATGLERGQDGAPGGAFQLYVVLQSHMVAPIPGSLEFDRAAVLPLAVSTAATGLFQTDHLALEIPAGGVTPKDECVLVWGGSTSVGANAIQLATHAGYRVVSTASPRNFEYVKSLGAVAVVDYHDPQAAAQLKGLIGSAPLAGSLALGLGSLAPTVQLAGALPGSRRVAAAQPALLVHMARFRARRRDVSLTAICGGSLARNEVGPAMYIDFLPRALDSGTYRATPDPIVAGHGLEAVPDALLRLKKGVSAAKVVVTV